MSQILLPDGSPPPTGDAAIVLALFDPMGITHGSYPRAQFSRHLAGVTRVAPEPHRVEAIISELTSRGLLVSRGVYADPSLIIDDGPGGADECFVTTPLGKKAARLCKWLAEPGSGIVAGTATERSGLADTIVEAIGEGAGSPEVIDVACCCAAAEEVEAATDDLMIRGFVERSKGGQIALLPLGVARHAQLRHRRQEAMMTEFVGALNAVQHEAGSARPPPAEAPPPRQSPPAPLAPFIPGELRARFEAVHELGDGSFASVYEVVDRESRERFALKVVRHAPEARSRAVREVAAAKALRHASILEALEFHRDGEWFLLPLAEGTLGQFQDWKRLPPTAAVDVALAVGHALEHAHEADFLHRDLHPDNVLRHDGRWKVADWGLAVARDQRRLTRTRSTGGNEIWTAPEQLRSLKDADARSDLFSLGRLVQWLATGTLPDPARPGSLPSDHPLAGFVNAATRLEREERPQNVEDALGLLGFATEDIVDAMGIPAIPARGSGTVPITYSASDTKRDASAPSHLSAPIRSSSVVPSAVEQTISAVEDAAPSAELRVKRFMAELTAALLGLAPVWKQGAQQDDEDALIAALASTTDHVADFARVSQAVVGVSALPSARAMYDGLRSLVARYDTPRGYSGPVYRRDFDFFKVLSHELLVTLTAAAVADERWALLDDVLREELFVEYGTGPRSVPFTGISADTFLLTVRSERTRRTSVQADLLKERHSAGELGRLVPLAQFVDADVLLFLRGELMQPPTQPGQWWFPHSAVYLEYRVPPYLVKGERVGYAESLLKAFGADTLENMRAAYRAQSVGWGRIYGSTFSPPLAALKLDKLATR